MWQVILTKQDAKKLAAAGFKSQAEALLTILAKNPYESYPPYEKLKGDLLGYYSRRINIQHRLVYEVMAEKKIVKVLRMWSHYE
jgi:Txe/YoeB family toxin of toxin-antitoxin system